MAQKIIIALTAIAVIVLFRAMHHELAGPPEIHHVQVPLDVGSVLASIKAAEHPCDAIDAFKPLGKSNLGWEAYYARCHDGGRYVFFQDPEQGSPAVRSCAEEAQLGYRCPP